MGRKTILTLTLAAATALTAIPLLAQTAPAAPDCAADPAACQALVDRLGPGMGRGEGGRWDDRDDREGWRGGERHDKRDGRGWGRDGDPGPWQSGMLQRFDTDADGSVSADEARAGVAALVTQFDTNADQALTVEEFTSLHAELTKPMAARSFGMIDVNADGRIDATEADAVAQRIAGGRRGPAPAAIPAPSSRAAPGAAGQTPAAPATTPGN